MPLSPGRLALAASLLLALSCARTTDSAPASSVASDAAPAAASAQRRYVGHSPDECARMRFRCDPGTEYFADDKGCGCEGEPVVQQPVVGDDGPSEAETGHPDDGSHGGAIPPEGLTRCTPEGRRAEACAEIYEPVCGLFDPDKVQCIKAPCGQTYSNSCEACRDANVLGYSAGECD